MIKASVERSDSLGHWKLGLEFGPNKGISKEDVQTVSGIQLERKEEEGGVDQAGT